MPKVSIVLPTCDRPELLARALDSVAQQTFEDYEVVVVDDGREPHAADVVARRKDDRIRVCRHTPGRQGGSAARNTGIKNSSAQLIAFLDDDDAWVPEKLALQVAAMEKAPKEVGFCVTGALVESEEGAHINRVEEGVHDFSSIALIRLNGFLTTSLMMRRAVFDQVGYFDEAFPSHQEAELMIRVSERFLGVGINQPLVRMNMFAHEHIGGSLERRIAGRLLLLAKHEARFRDRPDLLARHHFTLGIWYRDSGQLGLARKEFFLAWGLKKHPRYLAHGLLLLVRTALSGRRTAAP